MPLNYYNCGEGFPLVILHGLFGASDNWQTLSAKFKPHYKVFALDLRNHGKSPHDNDVSYPAMARDVAEFLDEHRLESVFVLGHSMGGKVAMQLANDFPARVQRLVVGDIAPRAYQGRYDYLFTAMLGVDLSRYRSRGEVDQALAPSIPETNLRQFLLKNLSNDANGRLQWKINLRALFNGYDALTAALTLNGKILQPTLFVCGERSCYIEKEDEALIHQAFRAATIVTIKDAGHRVHAEKPDEFFQAVHEFLG